MDECLETHVSIHFVRLGPIARAAKRRAGVERRTAGRGGTTSGARRRYIDELTALRRLLFFGAGVAEHRLRYSHFLAPRTDHACTRENDDRSRDAFRRRRVQSIGALGKRRSPPCSRARPRPGARAGSARRWAGHRVGRRACSAGDTRPFFVRIESAGHGPGSGDSARDDRPGSGLIAVSGRCASAGDRTGDATSGQQSTSRQPTPAGWLQDHGRADSQSAVPDQSVDLSFQSERSEGSTVKVIVACPATIGIE